mgnify:CR=1 FL=1
MHMGHSINPSDDISLHGVNYGHMYRCYFTDVVHVTSTLE